jgi:hypothetical protein
MNYDEMIEKLHSLGLDNDYDWYGDWSAPGVGQYVIRMNGKEMEPGQVIELLESYSELLAQTKRSQ